MRMLDRINKSRVRRTVFALIGVTVAGTLLIVRSITTIDDIHDAMRSNKYSDHEIIKMIEDMKDLRGYSEHLQRTFLSEAIMTERPDVVGWLIDQGADPNGPGIQPLFQVLANKDLITARKLLNKGADWNSRMAPDARSSVYEWALEDRPMLIEQLRSEGLAPRNHPSDGGRD